MEGNGNNLATAPRNGSGNLTPGTFAKEDDAQEWIVSFLTSCQYIDGNRRFFRTVAAQVPGQQLYRHHRQAVAEGGFRCDVLAIPEEEHIRTHLGAIVIEVKRSGERIGPGLSQSRDYLASVFCLGGVMVVPSFAFLFPCCEQHQATASWMQHQSLGGVAINAYTGNVSFHTGEERLLEFDGNGVFKLFKPPASGRKSGSR